MKRVLIVIMIALILICSIFLIRQRYAIQMDFLYSLSDLNNVEEEYQENNGTVITRNQAIQWAYEIFEQECNVDLLNEEVEMYVNLYNDTDNYNCYVWLMSWYIYDTNESFTCSINAETGEILYLYAGKKNKEQTEEQSPNLSYETVQQILNRFFKIADVDISEYEMQVDYPEKESSSDTWTQKCIFRKKGKKKVHFTVSIDCVGGFVREFSMQKTADDRK